MSGYGDFARFYDRLTENIDYRYIANYYRKLIKMFFGTASEVVDLACGTGSLSVLLCDMGYDVTGVDASEEMLSIALTKPHKNIHYICQPMQELNLPGTVDVIISSLDSINHLPSCEDILETFKRAAQFTVSGGLFIFDVNTPYKHENVLANETFIYDLDTLYCVWQNELDVNDKNHKVNMYLDFFSLENGGYQRYSDELSEIAPTIDVIEQMLTESGFEVERIYEYLTENEPESACEKLTVIARKI